MIVESIEDLPIKYQQRHRTDNLCTLINSIFVLTLFIAAIVRFNGTNLNKITYPTDISGVTCGLQAPSHPYLYFTHIQDTSKRLCVNQCPTASDTHLSCKPAEGLSCKNNTDPEFRVEIYDTKLEETRMGLFCLPTDGQLKERLLTNSGMAWKYHFLIAYDAIRISMIVAVVLGMLYVLITQYCHQNLPKVITGLGGFICLAFSVLVFVFTPTTFKYQLAFRVVIGLLLLIIALVLFIMMCYFPEQLRMCGIFLKQASNFLSTKGIVLLAIPVFMLLGTCLVALFVFQLLAYWSYSDPVFIKKEVYYDPQNNGAGIWTVLNFIELLWGLEFLKYAFSFIISGYSINYYFLGRQRKLKPIVLLLCFHWGSVLAGAFLLNFLVYLDLIFDAFMPADQIIQTNKPLGCCESCCSTGFGWIKPLFELARSQSMAYINLSGLPYCNASRYCEYINRMTNVYNGNQSVNRMYRIGAHCILVGLTVTFSLIYMQINNNLSVWAALFITVVSFFIVTFFISIHADAAQAILITFLTELLLCHNVIERVNEAPRGLKQLLKRERDIVISASVKGTPLMGNMMQTQVQQQQFPQQAPGLMTQTRIEPMPHLQALTGNPSNIGRFDPSIRPFS